MWQLNLDTRQWIRSTIDLPVPVYFHAMTVTEEGKMIMFGGVDDIESNTRTSAVYTAWLRIPSLRTLSWEAVCHYRQVDSGTMQWNHGESIIEQCN